jgi:hypothetical protein
MFVFFCVVLNNIYYRFFVKAKILIINNGKNFHKGETAEEKKTTFDWL